MSDHVTCRHPDRDEPKLMCGYPLPCPHHTVIIHADRGTVRKCAQHLGKQPKREESRDHVADRAEEGEGDG